MLAAINDYTRIVFLANPGNPTGTLLNAVTVDRFEVGPPHVIVVPMKPTDYALLCHGSWCEVALFPVPIAMIERRSPANIFKAHGFVPECVSGTELAWS